MTALPSGTVTFLFTDIRAARACGILAFTRGSATSQQFFQVMIQDTIQDLQNQLGAQGQASWGEGLHMAIDEAIALALLPLTHAPAGRAGAKPAPRPG